MEYSVPGSLLVLRQNLILKYVLCHTSPKRTVRFLHLLVLHAIGLTRWLKRNLECLRHDPCRFTTPLFQLEAASCCTEKPTKPDHKKIIFWPGLWSHRWHPHKILKIFFNVHVKRYQTQFSSFIPSPKFSRLQGKATHPNRAERLGVDQWGESWAVAFPSNA